MALDAGGVGLELGQAVLVDLRAVHAVGLAALVNPLERRQLAVVDGDDHLAADLVGDSLGRAELFHGLLAGPAVDRLERTRLVVDARVQDARVVAGLMMGQLGFLFEHHDAPAGVLPRDLIGRGQTDNSSANDRDIHLFHHASDFIPRLDSVERAELSFRSIQHSNRSCPAFQPLPSPATFAIIRRRSFSSRCSRHRATGRSLTDPRLILCGFAALITLIVVCQLLAALCGSRGDPRRDLGRAPRRLSVIIPARNEAEDLDRASNPSSATGRRARGDRGQRSFHRPHRPDRRRAGGRRSAECG